MSEYAIVADSITKKFGHFTAVKALSISVRRGCIYGFLGPNGCGKSTTIRMLTGLLQPTSGVIEVLGAKLPQQSESLRLKIGYMTQKFSLYTNLTVFENLKFVTSIYNLSVREARGRIRELLDTYNLESKQSRLVNNLSGGEKQRLSLAAATIHRPKLLFLDEPTSAVDPENRRDFWEKLFDLCAIGTTIFVSTHYMDEAERCHYLAILESGCLRANESPRTLMASLQAVALEIDGDNLRSLKEKLTKLSGVISVAQQGIRLRVLIDIKISEPLQWLSEQLGEAMNNRQVDIVRPSLEDVFVKYTDPGVK